MRRPPHGTAATIATYHHDMRFRLLPFALLALSGIATAQQSDAPALDATPAPPLPEIPALLQQVEANQHAAEALRNRYTYHVFQETTEVDRNGKVKKTESTDADSFAIDGIRVNREVAKNGKPLTPDEARKESDRIDKDVAKAKAHRADLAAKGQATTDRGNDELSVARILELGKMSNLRIAEVDGRRAFVVDYTGDPNAKTHAEIEGVFRDLVGTVWIDDQDRVLMRVEGHFVKDFKIGGGLIADMHKDTSFDFRQVKIDGEVWLPSSVDAHGKFSYLLFGGFSGSFKLRVTDYKKFRTTTTLIPTNHVVDENGNPVVDGEKP